MSMQNQLHYARGYTSILILRKHYSPNQNFGDSTCESKDGTPRLKKRQGLKSTKANQGLEINKGKSAKTKRDEQEKEER